MPIHLSVSPYDEKFGDAAQDQALSDCTLPIHEKWTAGETDRDGYLVEYSGFSIRLSEEPFDTIGEAAAAAVPCLERYQSEITALRDCPAVWRMTLFLHLTCRRDEDWQFDSRPRIPQRLLELAAKLGFGVQVHGVDGKFIA